MRWLDKLLLRLRSLFRRGSVEQELDAELRFHFEQQIEQNLAAGMNAEEARYAARRTIGRMAQIKTHVLGIAVSYRHTRQQTQSHWTAVDEGLYREGADARILLGRGRQVVGILRQKERRSLMNRTGPPI